MFSSIIIMFKDLNICFVLLTLVLKQACAESYAKEVNWHCEPYIGQACSEFLANQSVFLWESYSQSYVESKVAEAFTVIRISPDLSSQCSKYAIRAVCFHNFPPCNARRQYPARRLCKDECALLESDICNIEYTIAKKHPLLGKQDLLPICADLPPVGSPEHDACIRLGTPTFTDYSDESCFEGKGETYRGNTSKSASNEDCLPWSNGDMFKWREYEELRGGHNFCRNPGNKRSRPWCYINNQTNPIQFCNIPPCVDFTEFWLYVLIPVMAAVLLFSVIVCIWCMVYRVNLKAIIKVQEDNKALELHEELEECRNEKQSAVNALQLPIQNIKFCQELGEGAFGKVYKGQALGLLSDKTVTPVAIKTLKINATHKVKQEFKREVELMAYLQHPNIICLLGVCINEQPMCMLFEFMSCGDLHEYLVSNFMQTDDLSIGEFSEDMETGSTFSSSLSLRDLLFISSQIASGMEYLSSHHYVHRDLATRNCLVGDNMTVKISDFGLSRDIYSSDYYRVQSKSLLPVRWMPPESILYGKFTSESDVWSFGVVLWEIFNFGIQPYYGRSNQEVIDMIRSRQLLPCPPNCPPQIYGLMLQTWHALPSQRPTFRAIYDDLRLWLKVFSSVDNLNLSLAPSSITGGSRASTLRRGRPSNRTSYNDLYAPWKPRPQMLAQNSYQHPAFIDERFEPRITVV